MSRSAWDDDDPMSGEFVAPEVRRTIHAPGGVVNVPVDVGRVLTHLETLALKLEDLADQMDRADHEATQAQVLYEVGYARALLQSTQRSKEQREAEAIIKVAAEFEDWKMKDRVVRSIRDASFAARDAVRAWQSVSAIVREMTATPNR